MGWFKAITAVGVHRAVDVNIKGQILLLDIPWFWKKGLLSSIHLRLVLAKTQLLCAYTEDTILPGQCHCTRFAHYMQALPLSAGRARCLTTALSRALGG